MGSRKKGEMKKAGSRVAAEEWKESGLSCWLHDRVGRGACGEVLESLGVGEKHRIHRTMKKRPGDDGGAGALLMWQEWATALAEGNQAFLHNQPGLSAFCPFNPTPIALSPP